MAWKDAKEITLSKSILEMKFMKRTKEKVEKQKYQQEGEEYFGKQGLPKHAGRYITETSYAFCEELIDGRLSFQGENPEIERIMELEQLGKNVQNTKESETDVSDIQMAKMWKSTTKINVKNISRKCDEINSDLDRQPQRKKLKFLKPQD